MTPKLPRETYKTYAGADKRARFENGLAKSEFERGFKAKHYHYTVIPTGDELFGPRTYRVQRTEKQS
jgi:hypothetical protein